MHCPNDNTLSSCPQASDSYIQYKTPSVHMPGPRCPPEIHHRGKRGAHIKIQASASNVYSFIPSLFKILSIILSLTPSSPSNPCCPVFGSPILLNQSPTVSDSGISSQPISFINPPSFFNSLKSSRLLPPP